MTADAEVLDRNLPDVDWFAAAPGAVCDRAAVPSGSLARVTLGPAGGPRVVLIPGATGSKEDFRLLAPLLADHGCRVEAFDLAGQYQSADAGPENLDPPRDRYDMRLFVDDVDAVLTRGPLPVHVAGYSFAGVVAALAALRRPGSVASLTLLDTPPVPGRALGAMRVVGPLLGKRASPAVAAWVLTAGIRLDLEGGTAARRRFVRERLRHTRRQSVRDIMAVMRDLPDLRPGLRAAPWPVLVAAGSHDLWSAGRHRAFGAACGARVAVYRAGHAPCETTPHQLAADMLRLFADAA